MDIAMVAHNCIRLKGKKVAIIIDPEKSIPKTSADAILLTGGAESDVSCISDSRIVLGGSGEYEVGGSKISAIATDKCIIYKLLVDNISIIVGRSLDFSKLESNFAACDIALINADSEFNESFITSLGPRIVVLYGDNNLDGAKKLGAQNLSPIAKLSVAKDKLPEKMEIVVLG